MSLIEYNNFFKRIGYERINIGYKIVTVYVIFFIGNELLG